MEEIASKSDSTSGVAITQNASLLGPVLDRRKAQRPSALAQPESEVRSPSLSASRRPARGAFLESDRGRRRPKRSERSSPSEARVPPSDHDDQPPVQVQDRRRHQRQASAASLSGTRYQWRLGDGGGEAGDALPAERGETFREDRKTTRSERSERGWSSGLLIKDNHRRGGRDLMRGPEDHLLITRSSRSF
jgi:hypothetical protein